MKCQYCNGTGEHINDANRMTTCEFCGGTGKIEVTNEEWFCGLSTEEKAKYIAKAMFFYDSKFKLTLVEALRTATRYEQGLNKTLENDVVYWLKEKHDGNS